MRIVDCLLIVRACLAANGVTLATVNGGCQVRGSFFGSTRIILGVIDGGGHRLHRWVITKYTGRDYTLISMEEYVLNRLEGSSRLENWPE